MRLISAISYKWAKSIADRLYQGHDLRRLYYYWIRLIFGIIVKMSIVFVIAWLLDVFLPTFYCAVTYGIIKVLSGGLHHRPLGRSILLSVMLFITMGVVADTFTFLYRPFDDVITKEPFIYVWIMLLYSLLCAIFFVPVKVKNKVSFWNVRKYLYKILTLAFISYVMFYSMKVLNLENLELVISIWTAIMFNAMISIPFIYFGVTKLNQILNYK